MRRGVERGCYDCVCFLVVQHTRTTKIIHHQHIYFAASDASLAARTQKIADPVIQVCQSSCMYRLLYHRDGCGRLHVVYFDVQNTNRSCDSFHIFPHIESKPDLSSPHLPYLLSSSITSTARRPPPPDPHIYNHISTYIHMYTHTHRI